MSDALDFTEADLTMLSHVAAFRERGYTEPHPDCAWCEDAQQRGLWDAPLRRYRVRFYYEAVVEVNALDGTSARDRASLRAEPELVDSHADDLDGDESGTLRLDSLAFLAAAGLGVVPVSLVAVFVARLVGSVAGVIG